MTTKFITDTKDLRPFINQEFPQDPEQIFSTNFYHKINGTSQLCKEIDENTLKSKMSMAAFVSKHQDKVGVLNMSDCGTGKTRAVLDFLCDLKMIKGQLPPVIVLAPLSILEPAWGGDIDRWTPNLKYQTCYAKNREESALTPADIHLFNHDAIKWLMDIDQTKLRKKFKGGILIVDEFTAFKNMDSQRTQAAINFSRQMSMVIELSGTPMPLTVLDLFTPAMIADGGHRLGKNFYQFRHKVCTPTPLPHNPRIMKWEDKPEARQIIANSLEGMAFRFEAKGVPLNAKRHIQVKLPPKAMKAYKEMLDTDLMFNDDGSAVNAVNAGARFTKLLQLCTGAAYNSNGDIVSFHKERYELVATLVQEVDHSVIGFNWKHERLALEAIFKKQKISYAVIDGSVKVSDRVEIVARYQRGELQTLICHPKSAGHGLTFTKGRRTIWCSATNNAEYFLQYNKRIDRKGQKNETETIMISAAGTKEDQVFEGLFGKVSSQADFLAIFAKQTEKTANIS